jgi:hypothetical protein
MPMNQVVLYFDKQEDALLFTVAASSIMSGDWRFRRPAELVPRVI